MADNKRRVMIKDDGQGRLILIVVAENGTEAHMTLVAGTTMLDAQLIGQAVAGKVADFSLTRSS